MEWLNERTILQAKVLLYFPLKIFLKAEILFCS